MRARGPESRLRPFLVLAPALVACAVAPDSPEPLARTVSPLEVWTRAQELVPSDSSPDVDDTGAWFGRALALSGDTLLVGARNAAYVFVYDGSSWVEQQRLDGVPGSAAPVSCGASVALSGDTALVGCPREGASGHALVFVRSASTWSLQQTLEADSVFEFGGTVALDGDTALIGTPFFELSSSVQGTETPTLSAVAAYTRTGATWESQALLVSAQISSSSPRPSPLPPSPVPSPFGYTVALFGDTAVVGAGDGAFTFERSAGAWARDATLWTEFAERIAIFGDTIAVAKSLRVQGLQNDPAKTGIFAREGGTWRLQDSSEGTRSGPALALASEDTLLFGGSDALVRRADPGKLGWSLFHRDAGAWRQTQTSRSQHVGANVVAVSKDWIVTGARSGSTSGADGKVTVFRSYTEHDGTCSADADCVSRHCVEGVCCDSACDDLCSSCLAEKKGYGSDGICELREQTESTCSNDGRAGADGRGGAGGSDDTQGGAAVEGGTPSSQGGAPKPRSAGCQFFACSTPRSAPLAILGLLGAALYRLRRRARGHY